MMDEIVEKIRYIITDQLDLDRDEVLLETKLVDDLKADSLDLVEIAMTIEETFDIEVPDEDIENLKTVREICEYVKAKL